MILHLKIILHHPECKNNITLGCLNLGLWEEFLWLLVFFYSEITVILTDPSIHVEFLHNYV